MPDVIESSAESSKPPPPRSSVDTSVTAAPLHEPPKQVDHTSSDQTNIDLDHTVADRNVAAASSSTDLAVVNTTVAAPAATAADDKADSSSQSKEEEMTPRSKKRFAKSEARRIAKEKRDGERAKAKAERDAAKAKMKNLSGEERDEARKKMKEDAEKKRQEQSMDRKADLAKQQAMEDPAGKPVKMSAEVIAHLAKKKREEEEAAAKKAIEDEEQRIREEAESRITCAHQENDRYSSRVRIQISKSGTSWGRWHSRYVSLGYRELRVYNRYENRIPSVIYKIPSGSVARYMPMLKMNGGINENPDKVGGLLTLDVVRANGLRNADGMFGKSDPYCEIFFNGKKIMTTPTIDDTLAPVWKHSDVVEINSTTDLAPAGGKWLNSELIAVVWDEDEGGEPDFLGQHIFRGDELTRLLHNNFESTTTTLENRIGAKVGLLGSERKAKGTITLRMKLESKTTADRPHVLEFSLKEVKQRDDEKLMRKKKKKKKKKKGEKGGVKGKKKGEEDEDEDEEEEDGSSNMGRTVKSKKKRKKKGKRNEDGVWVPDVEPLTGLDRRGIGTTPARHNGTESIPKSPEQRAKERDRVPGKIKIRMQLPNIQVTRKWIYVLIEYFPNIVTFLHTTREEAEEEERKKNSGNRPEDSDGDEMESVFTEMTEITTTGEEKKVEGIEERIEGEEEMTEMTEITTTKEKTFIIAGEEKKKEEKEEEENIETKSSRGEEKEVEKVAQSSSSPKKKKRIKVYRKKKNKKKKVDTTVLDWENNMSALFTEISKADSAGVNFSLRSLLNMMLDTRHEGRLPDRTLPRLSDASRETMRSWRPLSGMLRPKSYRKSFQKFHKKITKHGTSASLSRNLLGMTHVGVDWEQLANISGLATKAAKYEMQHRDGTRKEMLSAAEVQRKKDRAYAAVCRERREEREKLEEEKKRRRREQEARQAAASRIVQDRESQNQAAREAEMGVPHEHLCISITDERQQPYCQVCRQLAWQTAQLKWRSDEEKKRKEYTEEMQRKREEETEIRKKAKIKIRLATSTPIIQETLRKEEKKRRRFFLKQDESSTQFETSRRDEWNRADDRHRTKERMLRPIEAAALRRHTEHRTTWLQAVTTFRDRTLIARLLWQRLLDKTSSFSSGNMRHLCWDQSFEEFRVCHFLACKSQPSAAMIMERAQTLKSLALGCSDLIRVRDCWYQPGEGAAGYGFVALVMLDYCGNPKTTNTVERIVQRTSSIPEMTALRWGRSVARGLCCMHHAGLVHGNVKPSNVFVDDVGSVRLGDYPFPKSTSPQPLMKQEGVTTDVFEFGLFLYYVCTGGAIMPMDEYGDCAMSENSTLKMIPVRFGETLKEVIRLSLFHHGTEGGVVVEAEEEENSVSMRKLVDLLHQRVRELELITELHQARVLLLDNAMNVIDDQNDGFILKKDWCHAIEKNSTTRAILSQDRELALLIHDPVKVGRFIMKMATKRGGEEMEYVEADDILKLVKQMMITKMRDLAERERVREEELRIKEAEEELALKMSLR